MRFATLALFVLSAAATERNAPRLTVDLDTDPYHRWDAAVDQFYDAIQDGIKTITSMPQYSKYLTIGAPLMQNEAELKAWYPDEMWRELEGIAARSNQSLGLLTVLSSLYDIVAAAGLDGRMCTGIVAQTGSGEILHGRNLDWSRDLVPIMCNLTAIVDWKQGNKTLYTSVSYIFMPAFNTVMRPGAFSISHDERDAGSLLDNMFDVFVRRRVMTFALIRQVAQEEATFADAVARLSAAKTSTASYFIVAGVAAGEGAVITRGRDSVVNTWRLGDDGGWYVIETNYDHWQAPGKTDNRRAPAERMLNATGSNGMDTSIMWKVMTNVDARPSEGERPTWNSDTVYSTVMQPAHPERLRVTIHDPPYPGPHPDHLSK